MAQYKLDEFAGRDQPFLDTVFLYVTPHTTIDIKHHTDNSEPNSHLECCELIDSFFFCHPTAERLS